MTLYARSMESCSVDSNAVTTEVVTAGRYDNTYGIRLGLFITTAGLTNYITTRQGIGGPYTTTFWHRAIVFNATFVNAATLYEYRTNAGVAIFRIFATATNTLQPQYWSGAAWVNTGASFVMAINSLYKMDLKIIGATSFEWYFGLNSASDPPLVSSGTTGALATSIDEIRAYATTTGGGGNTPIHSEWIWGDESTQGHRYVWRPPSGDGTDTAGTGTYLDVDEAVTNDSDFSALATSGNAETYVHTAMTVPSGIVKAVQVESRVRNVVGGAQNVKARLRVGGVAYDQASNFPGITTAFGPYVARWATNPAGGAWTPTTASQTTNEFGLLAQT